ncbi:MAG: hypothetical protein ACK559_34420, partial [bacterium]
RILVSEIPRKPAVLKIIISVPLKLLLLIFLTSPMYSLLTLPESGSLELGAKSVPTRTGYALLEEN